MYVFSLWRGPVSTAEALFQWHLCHVAACLRRKLGSTEEKLFFMSQRFLLNPHTRSYPTGRAYLLCVRTRVFVLDIMGPLDVVVAILRAWFSLAEPVVNK